MKDSAKFAWGLVGGMILGAIASSAVSRGKLRPCTTKLMSYGIDLKEKLVESAESLKENIEDMTAEAKEQADQRAAKKQAEDLSKEDITPEVEKK